VLLACPGVEFQAPVACNNGTALTELITQAKSAFPVLKKSELAFSCNVAGREIKFQSDSSWSGAVFLINRAKALELVVTVSANDAAPSVQSLLPFGGSSPGAGNSKRGADSELDGKHGAKRAKAVAADQEEGGEKAAADEKKGEKDEAEHEESKRKDKKSKKPKLAAKLAVTCCGRLRLRLCSGHQRSNQKTW
jgi:hypothetical protein